MDRLLDNVINAGGEKLQGMFKLAVVRQSDDRRHRLAPYGSRQSIAGRTVAKHEGFDGKDFRFTADPSQELKSSGLWPITTIPSLPKADA